MTCKLFIKSTFLFFSLLIVCCGSNKKENTAPTAEKKTIALKTNVEIQAFKTGAENY